jgi:hypothetical protein
VGAWAQLPTIRITTQNNQEPTVGGGGYPGMGAQTMNYVKITRFQLEGAGNHNLDLTPEPTGEADSIRVRGNSTASADKKPYRIKFDKQQALFGKQKAKSWVLLANYYDQTFALNAIAFRLGQKLELEFTNTSQFVQLYINGSYKGLYQLTEQLQVHTGRVDIDTSRGFLVEFDYHDAASDEIKFTAAQYSLGTFIKSPEVAGCDAKPVSNCNVNNAKVKWVQDTINALMNKMAASGFPTNGYRDMIDLESFAKYVLIEQLMDNFDFNSKVQDGALPGSNYAYKKSDRSPIYAGPLWDFDLSAVGCGGGGGFPGMGCSFTPHYQSYNEPIRPKHTFYQRLWADPAFMAKLKKAWDRNKSTIDAIPTFIDSLANALSGGVANNKSANPTNLMMGSTTLTTQIYNQEVQKLKTWWPQRVKFFDDELKKLNIDTTADNGTGGNPIVTPTNYTLTVSRTPSAGGNVSVTVGSGSAQTNPSGQLTASANTSIKLTATANSGYTFTNWTAVSGSLPSGITATNPTITFNITANVNVMANFTGGTTPPGQTNYTLQVSRNPQDRGNVTVTVGSGSPQSNPTNSISIPSGTSVTIAATSAVSPSGNTYNFQNWTAVGSGSLPTGVTATTASNTFTITGNVNIRANFQSAGQAGTTYTLTVGSNPSNGGSVSVNGAPSSGQPTTHASGETVVVTAAASTGYAFREWTGSLPEGVDKNSATITLSMSANVSIVAAFRENTGGGNRTDTLKVEAEDMTSSNPSTVGACPANAPDNQPMCVSTNSSSGVTNIGYISSGNSATYEVNMARQGQYTMIFRIASNVQSTFRVTVNGVPMGTVSGNTQDWDGYTNAALSYPDVPLDAGQNTIKLDFQSAVNVDYFLIIGEEAVAVRYSVPNKVSKARVGVTLRANPSGFTAVLPSNHGYTSYRLIDMRGRAVRSGKVGPGITDLRFDGLKRSVMFLKLEGGKGNKPLILRAVIY